MGDKSAIEWTDATWTPIRARVKADAVAIAEQKCPSLLPIVQQMVGHVGPHCERVSPGCERCYSETNNSRCLPNNGTGLPFDRRARDLVDIFVDEKILAQPLRWRDPKNVFVCSQTDLFGEWVPDEVINRVFAVMSIARSHTFQILTKRPERMKKYLTDDLNQSSSNMCEDEMFQRLYGVGTMGGTWPLPNVWLGVSVENQKYADERIPLLLQTQSAVRWISAEPLLGPVDLLRVPHPIKGACPLTGIYGKRGDGPYCTDQLIKWVVVGGESGPGARPMHPDWARSLRDQCSAADVPFFFKQWGEYEHIGLHTPRGGDVAVWEDGDTTKLVDGAFPSNPHAAVMRRVGKHAAGRLLDGVEHSEYPEVSRG